MKIKFLKQHDIYSEGDTEELPDGLANYLIRCNVAELDNKPKLEKKVVKPKLEKK